MKNFPLHGGKREVTYKDSAAKGVGAQGAETEFVGHLPACHGSDTCSNPPTARQPCARTGKEKGAKSFGRGKKVNFFFLLTTRCGGGVGVVGGTGGRGPVAALEYLGRGAEVLDGCVPARRCGTAGAICVVRGRGGEGERRDERGD